MADDLMEDLFGEDEDIDVFHPTSSTSGKADLSGLGEDTTKVSSNRSRNDSDLDNLFGELGLSPSPSSPRNASSSSLGDVDSFLNNLTKNSSTGSLNNKEAEWNASERDEFLNWLDDGEEISLNTNTTKIDENMLFQHKNSFDDDDEVDFFLESPSSPSQAKQKQKNDTESAAQKEVSEKQEEEPEEEIVPLPEVGEIDAASFSSIREPRLVSACLVDTGSMTDAVTKVQNRLDTLFDIEQYDTHALLSALVIKGVAGLVMPPKLRLNVWKAVLCESDMEAPSWVDIPEDRFAEIFPSVRKLMRKDCEDLCNVFYQPKMVDGLVKLVCRLTLRQSDKVYDVLLTNIAGIVMLMQQGVGNDDTGHDIGRIVDALCQQWGGRQGEWQSTGLQSRKKIEGVGGAGFASSSAPLVEFRRQVILSKLLAFHDPALSLYLESNCRHWNLLNDDHPPEMESTVNRVIRLSVDISQKLPSRSLFGLLGGVGSVLDQEQLLALWDGVILSRRHPQAMSFFFAVSVLMLSRAEISNGELNLTTVLKHLLAKSTRSIHNVVSLALALVDETPDYLMKWLSEEELLLEIPSDDILKEFCEAQKQTKIDERNLLVHDEASPLPSADENEDEEHSPTGVAPPPAPAPEKTSWISTAIKKRAQNIKSALTISASGYNMSSLDWSKYHVHRRLIEFRDDTETELGLTFRQGKNGLEVGPVPEGSIACNTGLVHEGDLAMTLNGLLVLGLSSSDAQALVGLQEYPFYMVLATLLPKDDVDEEACKNIRDHLEPDDLFCPSLEERITRYYAKYNPEKEKEVFKILGIYSYRESVLLEELQMKYMDHIQGDPFYLPLSTFSMPVDPVRLVEQLSFKDPHDAGARPSTPLFKSRTQKSKKLFIVDCRPKNSIAATGRFPTCYILDPLTLKDNEVLTKFKTTFEAMGGELEVCVLGRGTDALLADFNPKMARISREKDRRAVDTCVLELLKMGVPLVGVVQGGFLGCYMALRRLGYSVDDCLVNIPTNRATLDKYDAFIRYHTASPGKAAAFLASKAKAATPKARADTSISFSGIDEDKSIVGKASALFSTVWKKSAAPTSVATKGTEGPGGMEKVAEVADDKPEAPAAPKEGEKKKEPVTASSFFSSVWRKDVSAKEDNSASGETKEPQKTGGTEEGENEKGKAQEDGGEETGASSSSWGGWSSRLKSFKVPDTSGLGMKLRTSVNQAYNTASTKLAVVANELDGKNSPSEKKRGSITLTKEDEALIEEETDPEILARIAGLKKEDLVCLNDLGKHALFQVQKEKVDDKINKVFAVKRLLVVTTERFLVLDPHPMRPGYGYVKSNRVLKQVARLRFPNSDPSYISLFYTKDNDKQVTYIYKFPENANKFTKTIMQACARYNTKHENSNENTATSTKQAEEGDDDLLGDDI